MDAEFRWFRLRTLGGWISINTEHVSEVQKFAPNGWSVRMASGGLYLISDKEAIRLCEALGI